MPSRPYSSFGSGDETGFPNRRAAAMAIPENDALSDALAQLNRLVVDQESLDERLNRVAALSCTTVSVCNMAAMTLMRDGRPSTDVCTDEATKEIDAAQYATGTGPCLDAYVHREPRRIGSTRTDPRWPEFARAARDHGILSTLSRAKGVPNRLDHFSFGRYQERLAAIARETVGPELLSRLKRFR